jgi:hypothetical protein
VRLLNRHPSWAQTQIRIGEVELAATRIRFQLHCDTLAPEPALIVFDQRDGMVLASIEEPGWMLDLSPVHSELLRVALIGFYKLAAVELVAEHVQAAVAEASSDSTIHFDVRRRQLVVWPDDGFEREVAYDLSNPPDSVRRLIFANVAVPWPLWRSVWDAQTPKEIAEITGQIAPDVDVLPAACARRTDRPGPTAGFPVLPGSNGQQPGTSEVRSPAAPVAS